MPGLVQDCGTVYGYTFIYSLVVRTRSALQTGPDKNTLLKTVAASDSATINAAAIGTRG